jgi:hypothetical protein
MCVERGQNARRVGRLAFFCGLVANFLKDTKSHSARLTMIECPVNAFAGLVWTTQISGLYLWVAASDSSIFFAMSSASATNIDAPSTSTSSYWVSSTFYKDPPPRAICLGTGRFLRSVLVPLLCEHGADASGPTGPVLIQTRGTSFVDYMQQRSDCNTYEVDTVLASGVVETLQIPCAAVFSMRDPDCVHEILLPALLRNSATTTTMALPIRMIGVGVTEHGLASAETKAMKDLYDILKCLQQHHHVATTTTAVSTLDDDHDTTENGRKICIINTDNVPHNGDVLRRHMLYWAEQDEQSNETSIMRTFLQNHVAFLNSMVDRITSQRSMHEPLVPRAEPIPSKALVVLDEHGDLPVEFVARAQETKTHMGLVIRRTAAELQRDLALKLRIANGTHTALAHVLALCGWPTTNVLSLQEPLDNDQPPDAVVADDSMELVRDFVEALVEHQILPATKYMTTAASTIMSPQTEIATADPNVAATVARAVWTDWQQRLLHPHFGLSTFFITQNGAAKGGIRLGPTIVDLLQHCQSMAPVSAVAGAESAASAAASSSPVTVVMALVFAVLLRWLTPAAVAPTTTADSADDGPTENDTVYTGWLNGCSREYIARQYATAPPATVGTSAAADTASIVTYADGLRYNLEAGWYEFRCACAVTVPGHGRLNDAQSVSAWLASYTSPQQPMAYVPIVRAYLTSATGGDLTSVADLPIFESLVWAIATLYARLVAADDLLELLRELRDQKLFSVGTDTYCSSLVAE